MSLLIADTSGEWSDPRQLETESSGTTDRLWCQTGPRGAQFGENGAQQLLQERDARCPLFRPERSAVCGEWIQTTETNYSFTAVFRQRIKIIRGQP